VSPGRRINQLSRNPHAITCLAYTAFEHVSNAQLAPDQLYVHGAALIGEAGITGDNEKPVHARERGNDFLDDAVGEILLLRIAAHILEGQHGNRRLVRERQRHSCRNGARRRVPRVLGRTGHKADETKALPRNGPDQSLLFTAVADRFPRSVDAGG
jgi:hypothetical protein